MATTNTRPAECCEASAVGRRQNYASAMGEPRGSHACWAERSPEGGFGILHGVATGTASRAIRGAAPYPHSQGNVSCTAALSAAQSYGDLPASRPPIGWTGSRRILFAAPVAACMAREMGPPRRVEDCAGAFTHAPVAQLEERPSSKRRRAGSSPAWSTIHPRSSAEEQRFPELMVAGSSPVVGNIPFREVTK